MNKVFRQTGSTSSTGDDSLHNAMKTESLTDRVARAVETELLEGKWAPGDRLPGERVLAERFGCGRVTVRSALQRLTARGLLISRPASGVFVSDRLQTGLVSPWRQIIAENPELRPDMLEFRLMLEGTTSYLAAIRATDEDLARMQALIDALRDAHRAGDTAREAQLDGQFHSALAHASHNTMFRHLHGSLTHMLSEHISLNNAGLEMLRGEVSKHILEQHLALWDAIRNRRADDARRLMREHIVFVWQQLEPDTPMTDL